MMQRKNSIELRKVFADPRIDVYRWDGADDHTAFARYLWDMDLGKALYPALHCLEVSLRNAIDVAAKRAYGGEGWLRGPNSPLLRRERDMVTDTETTVIDRMQRAGLNPPTSLSHDKMISELSFGFWTSLFNRDYQTGLFPAIAAATFPAAKGRQLRRQAVWSRFDAIRRFRNRVYHHEPIVRNDPRGHYNQITQAIGLISPKALTLLGLIDDFNEIYERGEEHYLKLVQDAFP